MKRLFRYIVSSILGLLARAVLRRYRPKVLMITGSIGKTSTKDAIGAVLETRFFIRKSEKSFNSEFGVPFTIFGVPNPWKNTFSWLFVFKKALSLILLPNHYPKMLVLEVGSERPGDLARILHIATPDVVVVTRLPEIPVHVEAYTSPEAVREEEFSPAYALPPGAPLIVLADDAYAVENARRTGARVISYGTAEGATVKVEKIDFYESNYNISGMQAYIQIGNERGHLVISGSVGVPQIFPGAAAVAAAYAFGMPLDEALTALKSYVPPPGRGRLLEGKNRSIIIDESYNASPAAVEQALNTLKTFPHAKRRIAVLGDMLELGRYSVSEHQRIALLANESADIVAAIGVRSRAYAAMATHADVRLFENSEIAGEALAELVKEGDVILVKGSQSIRTERIVKTLLANPDDVAHLVRQDDAWKKKL